MGKTHIPQIRFKGFDGEWEKSVIKDIFKVTRGYVLATKDMSAIQDSKYCYPVYSSQTSNKGITGYYDKYLYENAITWTTDGANAGDVNYREGKFYCTNVCGVLLNNSGYSNLCFAKAINRISKNYVSYVGNPKLMNNVMSEIRVFIPTSISEQNRIASLFTSLDKQISTSEAKLDKLRTIKKTLLKKMFASQGEKTPQIRFKGFDGEWGNSLIESVCEISTGKSNTQDKNDEGIYPFYVRSSIIERSDKYLYDEVAVLTAGDGVGTGKIYHYVNGKYNLHQRCYRMFNFKHIDSKFFFYVFSTKFYKRVMAMTAKSSVDSVRYDMIAKMNIQLPQNKNEQTKIANLLTSVDKQISLQEQKIEKLKAIKKTLLKKMFV